MNYKKAKIDLSIIIVAFNQHHELKNTITGVALQIKQNPNIKAELIIIDNGSSPPVDTIINANAFDFPLACVRRSFVEQNFRPASARNIGIKKSKGELIIFIDGDCIPGPFFLKEHFNALKKSVAPVVTLGHRIFIDGKNITTNRVNNAHCDLSFVTEIKSSSNYFLLKDRRLNELIAIDSHPMPFNCCHGCNVGVRKMDVENIVEFDEHFDGFWGYEDIDFCYRLWRRGAKILYVCEAYVYHQEGDEKLYEGRKKEARRNYGLVCKKIPGFHKFRKNLNKSYYEEIMS